MLLTLPGRLKNHLEILITLNLQIEVVRRFKDVPQLIVENRIDLAREGPCNKRITERDCLPL